MIKLLKKQKGVSLVVLILTVIILLILTGVTVNNIDIGTDVRNYNYMCADIELLQNKIMIYYNDENALPITGEALNIKDELDGQASSRDNNNYFLIDYTKLYNITLNYGGGTISNKDVYIVNEQSHEIYYLKGVAFKGGVQHNKTK